MNLRNYGRQLIATPFQIADGASSSDIVDLFGTTPVAIYVPAAWVAADITILASPDGSIAPKPFKVNGSYQSITVEADVLTPILPADWLGASFNVQLLSGVPGGAVNQTLAGSPIILLSRAV